jgi:tRNA(Ile)-lysidine synthetase-like protein
VQQAISLSIEVPGISSFGMISAELSQADPDSLGRHRRAMMHSREQLLDWSIPLLTAVIGEQNTATWHCFLPASVKLPLTLRTWQEGDRMTLTDGSTKKLGDIFTDAKVPLLFRPVWAVLTDADGEVLWLPALADGVAMKIEAPEEPAWLLKLSHRG